MESKQIQLLTARLDIAAAEYDLAYGIESANYELCFDALFCMCYYHDKMSEIYYSMTEAEEDDYWNIFLEARMMTYPGDYNVD